MALADEVEAPASIARRLSCLSSFYGYGMQVCVLEENPVANVKQLGLWRTLLSAPALLRALRDG